MLAVAGWTSLAACMVSMASSPHPFHVSFAEVDCDRERGEIQVSLALFAVDFEETLSRRHGKRVNLDRTEGVPAMIEDYLADRFVVTLPGGSKPRPRLSGREDEGKTVWLYFTVSLSPGRTTSKPSSRPISRPGRAKAKLSPLCGVQLKNRVLMELNTGQRNTVELRDGHWRHVLKFDPKTQEQVLRKRPMPKRASHRSSKRASSA